MLGRIFRELNEMNRAGLEKKAAGSLPQSPFLPDYLLKILEFTYQKLLLTSFMMASCNPHTGKS